MHRETDPQITQIKAERDVFICVICGSRYVIARVHTALRTLMNMRFEGNLVRDGKFWLAEIPLLDGTTQGRTRAEALTMIADWLETMVNRPHFKAEVHPRGKVEFEVSGSDTTAMTALLQRRSQRLAFSRSSG